MIKRRQTELDLLRIFALLAVIFVHCSGMGIDAAPMTDQNKQIMIFFESIVTWQIPIYVMISGRFFLDPEREVSSHKIIKSIWRIVIAFVFWDIVYQIYYVLSGMYAGLNWKGILSQAMIGPYHFWYLYMTVCMYAIVPFLRRIAVDRRLTEYFIILFFLFEFITYYGTELPVVGSTVAELLVKINFHFTLGYSGYYLLGYYLYKYGIPDRLEFLLYAFAAVLLITVGFVTVHRALIEGSNEEWYTKYLMPNIAIEAAAIYTLFTKRVAKYPFSDKAVKWITKLSEYSFGVYLIHALVIPFIGMAGISATVISPLFLVPVAVLCTFVISNILVGLLRRIPYLGKKIT